MCDVDRNSGVQRGPGAGLTEDPRRAAACLDAVDQADEPGPFGCVGSTDSIVSNRQMQVLTADLGGHIYLGGLCVFRRVGEGFGDDVVGSNL